jgi:hypothetical protein
VGLWARSYVTGEALNQVGIDRSRVICSGCGRLMYYDQDDSAMTELGLWPRGRGQEPRWKYESVPGPDQPDAGDEKWLNRLGIAVEWRKRVTIHTLFSPRTILVDRTLLIVPHWLLVCVFVFLPAWWFVRSVRVRACRLRAAARGLCPACGYDLRASTGRCPECGSRTREDREPGPRSAAPSDSSPVLDLDDRNDSTSTHENLLPVGGGDALVGGEDALEV